MPLRRVWSVGAPHEAVRARERVCVRVRKLEAEVQAPEVELGRLELYRVARVDLDEAGNCVQPVAIVPLGAPACEDRHLVAALIRRWVAGHVAGGLRVECDGLLRRDVDGSYAARGEHVDQVAGPSARTVAEGVIREDVRESRSIEGREVERIWHRRHVRRVEVPRRHLVSRPQMRRGAVAAELHFRCPLTAAVVPLGTFPALSSCCARNSTRSRISVPAGTLHAAAICTTWVSPEISCCATQASRAWVAAGIGEEAKAAQPVR